MWNVQCHGAQMSQISIATGKAMTSGDSLEKQLIICRKIRNSKQQGTVLYDSLYLRLTLFSPRIPCSGRDD